MKCLTLEIVEIRLTLREFLRYFDSTDPLIFDEDSLDCLLLGWANERESNEIEERDL